MSDYWLNVDITGCTIHLRGCTFEEKKAETPYKGINQLKRDGGWLPFDGVVAAERYSAVAYPNRTFKRCKYCKP